MRVSFLTIIVRLSMTLSTMRRAAVCVVLPALAVTLVGFGGGGDSPTPAPTPAPRPTPKPTPAPPPTPAPTLPPAAAVDVSSSPWFASASPLPSPPTGHDAYSEVEWGSTLFTHGKVSASVDAFHTAMVLDGNVNGTLWQRGISLFYTEDLSAGAAQFALDVAGNPYDTEESVWRWLCQARVNGSTYAAANMLTTTGETRPYMKAVYDMYHSGTVGAEEKVLSLCDSTVDATPPPGSGQSCFYADLYYGLYIEAHGNTLAAKTHLRRAGLSEYGSASNDYMWWVARVHNAVRKWPINSTGAEGAEDVVV